MNTEVLFSKKSDEWVTPQALYDQLHAEFRFQWDAAATEITSKCGGYSYYGPGHSNPEYRDALTIPWSTMQRERFWLNLPYSMCKEFVAKAAAEAKHGALVVVLVPARTDTRWFHDHIWDSVRQCARPKTEVRFLKGRLKFAAVGEETKNSAPFPSMVVVFHPHYGADR